MNTDTLISMMLAPILIKMVEPIVAWIISTIKCCWNWITSKFEKASLELSSKQYVGKFPVYNNNERFKQMRLITGIAAELIKRGSIVHKGQTKFMDADKPDISALGAIHYKGYTFTFITRTYNVSNELPCIEDKLVITHHNANKIRSFVNKCADKLAKEADNSFKQMYYGQTKNVKDETAYNILAFKTTTTFDDVFFPQKAGVIQSIDALLAGKLPKLSFYLHGEPGCGKSSLIKAIAAKTGYSLVEIKLSFVENDNELRNIMFNNRLSTTTFGEEGGSKYVHVSRRIYLFEDIDAECDVVYRRELQSAVPVETTTVEKSKKGKDDVKVKPTKKQRLTLPGILNVLDGILSIAGSIIVITTNHPEKLDPALVRFGRVTHNIQMGKLTSECAGDLIKKFHKGWSGRVRDNHYTPAELEAICLTNDARDVARIIATEA